MGWDMGDKEEKKKKSTSLENFAPSMHFILLAG